MNAPDRRTTLIVIMTMLALAPLTGAAQGFAPNPVFTVVIKSDRVPVVAGESVQFAAVISIDKGWHINTENPGDEFMVPTTIEWTLPEGWPEPTLRYPAGEGIRFEFSDQPINVWQGRAVVVGEFAVPQSAAGELVIGAAVTAQACNDTQCLPPTAVRATHSFAVAASGTEWKVVEEVLFAPADGHVPSPEVTAVDDPETAEKINDTDFGSRSLPLFLIGVFLAGLALNLTPCVFPLIPITVGFFAQQAKNRTGGTFWMALAYVIGIAVTYSLLGVAASLGGLLLGSWLQNPWVIGGIVLVLVALAASMFGLWEIRTPTWAHRAAGSRGGLLGSLLMGLMMGLVAAPCIGPFVLGLVTYVGQKGDPVFGFFAFFTLALGLGLPYLILGTFTGAINKLPMSGMWMVGIRRVFGVILIAMAAYFAAPLLPGAWGAWILSTALVLGGLYLLVIDRTGNDQPGVDRLMRLLTVVMIVVGLWMSPIAKNSTETGEHLVWQTYEQEAAQAAIGNGSSVILDFYADWCLPCRELDEKTFSNPEVAAVLAGFTRYKIDQTRSDETAKAVASRYGVRGVPTVIVFANGVEKFRITGFERAERFLQRLQ